MSVFLNKTGKTATVFVVSGIAAYVTGSSAIGCATGAGLGAYLYSASSEPFLSRCKQIFDGVVARTCQFLNWRPLSIVPTSAVVLSSTAGIYVTHQVLNGAAALCTVVGICSTHHVGYGVVSTIAGGVIGALPTVYILKRNGIYHPIDPLVLPPPIPNRVTVAPESLNHLNSPCKIAVEFGNPQGLNPFDSVYCSSAGIAVRCAALTLQHRLVHKFFFEVVNRTERECLEFILSRPQHEINPNYDIKRCIEFYTCLKFDVLPVTDRRARPARQRDQGLCRDALLATNGSEIIYPTALQFDAGLLTAAIDRATALVFSPANINPLIDGIYRAYAAMPAGPAAALGLPQAALEAGALAGADGGARTSAVRLAVALNQADKIPAGVLVEAVYRGAVAGAAAGIQQSVAIGPGGQPAAIAAGRVAGVQAGELIAGSLLPRTPIIAYRNFPVDMAYLLTRIRDRLIEEVQDQHQEEALEGVIPRPPRPPGHYYH